MLSLKIIRTLALGSLLLTASISEAQNNTFRFRRTVSVPSQEGWYTLPLPPDIFQAVSRDFADLRIYQLKWTDTIEVPYLLQIRHDVIEEEPMEVTVFNKSRKDDKLFFTFELGKNQKVNHLDLVFLEHNFNGYAQLEGSPDQKEWFSIDTLQRILSIEKDNIQFKATSLNFPLSDYRFMRLRIQADVALTLDSASFKKRQLKSGVYRPIPLQWSASSSKKTKATVLDVNLSQFQPVGSLTIETENKRDFYRQLSIEALRDSSKTPQGWTYYYDQVYSGYITSLDNHRFDFPYALAKKLKITIYNADNEPLPIHSLAAIGPQVELLAQFQPGETFLYFGNQNLSAPSYDVVHFKDKIPENLTALSLGPEEKLTSSPPKSSPLLENKLWLWAIMGVIIAVLGYFTMKMMKAKS